MHKSEGFIKGLYYGFNDKCFYIRVDPLYPFNASKDKTKIDVRIVKPAGYKYSTEIDDSGIKSRLFILKDEKWIAKRNKVNVNAVDIFEIEIPFNEIDANVNDEISLSVHVMKNGDEIERCPWRGYITFTRPSADFEKLMWY